MGSVKIRTNSGVVMKAPISTAEELDKVIKFLIAERDAMAKAEGRTTKDSKKKSKLAEDMSSGFEAARNRTVLS